MKKLRSKSGTTLIEMLVAIAILVLLVAGINTGMNASMKIYNDSILQAHSSALDNILATSMGDILRYSENIHIAHDGAASGKYVFTNYEYGAIDACFDLSDNVVVLKNNNASKSGFDLSGNVVIQKNNNGSESGYDLFTKGTYPDLKVTKLDVEFFPPHKADNAQEESGAAKNKDTRGNYFTVKYNISKNSKKAKSGQTIHCEHVIRAMNQSNTN